MEYRGLGRRGLKVSALTLGTMAFGGQADEDESCRIIDAALDAGINLIDTANVYGRGASEEITGRALKANGRRNDIVLATKFCGRMKEQDLNAQGASRYNIIEACEASLRRLQTDHIDLYQIHVMDLETPLEETFSALDALVRQGKVRYIGCSKWAPALIAEANALCKRYGWEALASEQPPYNLLDRRIEDELIWTCMRHGMAIIPWAPIGSGILSGKYSADGAIPEGSRFSKIGGRCNLDAVERADALKPLAEAKGVTLAEFCLAWVLRQPGITSPITGPRTVEQLQSSLKALDVEFTEEDYKRINAIAPPGSHVSNYWDSNVYTRLRHAVGITG